MWMWMWMWMHAQQGHARKTAVSATGRRKCALVGGSTESNTNNALKSTNNGQRGPPSDARANGNNRFSPEILTI